jgi:hypothetical protein
MIIIIFILILIWYFQPWVDYYKDYRGTKHLVLWYNWKGFRNFYDFSGDY